MKGNVKFAPNGALKYIIRALALIVLLAALALCAISCNGAQNDAAGDAGANEATGETPEAEGKVKVLVFTEDAPKGTKVSASILETIELDAENLPRNVVSDIAEVKGKYTKRDFYKGEYIISARLSDTKPIDDGIISGDIAKTDSEYIVVTDYVSANTGKDLYAALQKLIDLNPGRTLYFPDGEYQISRSLQTTSKPEESTSFYFSSNAILKAHESWVNDGGLRSLIALGAKETVNNIKIPGSNFYVMGGIFVCNGRCDGISIDAGRETLIKDVVILNSRYGIHIKEGTNNTSSDADIDDVRIVGNGQLNSAGIVIIGADNTISNARISNTQTGISSGTTYWGANITVENTAKFENATAFNGLTGKFLSNCVSVDYDIGFNARGGGGFMKQCTAIWTSDFAQKRVAFYSSGEMNVAIIGCKAIFPDNSVPNYFLSANGEGDGRVECPIYDATLVHSNDATHKYLSVASSAMATAYVDTKKKENLL